MLYHPFQGNYKQLNNNATSDDKVDEYEIVAIAKRLNISIDDMKQMSFVSLYNIIISYINDSNDESDTRNATQAEIDAFFGR